MSRSDNSACDEIYAAVLNLDQSDNYLLFKMSSCFLKGYDPEKLRFMLKSSDTCHVSDGLFILGELGDMTKEFVGELADIAKGADKEAASDAQRLLDPYL